MNAVDTNVLFYAHDQRYPVKQRVASELIATIPDGTLVWQVACEYQRTLAISALSRTRSCLSGRHLIGWWILKKVGPLTCHDLPWRQARSLVREVGEGGGWSRPD